METIGPTTEEIVQTLKQSDRDVLAKQQKLCPDLQKKISLIRARYGDLSEFLLKINPTNQRNMFLDTDDCFFGDYPTMTDIKLAYGTNAPQMWLIPQLCDLSEFCGVKNKLTKQQLEDCAFLITETYHYMKVSELMLFFFRFKQGKYGRFYGNVDPLVITSALFEFRYERIVEIDKKKQEQDDAERDAMFRNAVPPPKEFYEMMNRK